MNRDDEQTLAPCGIRGVADAIEKVPILQIQGRYIAGTYPDDGHRLLPDGGVGETDAAAGIPGRVPKGFARTEQMGFQCMRPDGPGEAACRFTGTQPIASRRLFIMPAAGQLSGINKVEVLDSAVLNPRTQRSEPLTFQSVQQRLECLAW